MKSSQLLNKSRCPKCAENGKDRDGDNLGNYSDGHSYCFSCGYSTGSTCRNRIAPQEKVSSPIPDLPEDVTTALGKEAFVWLAKHLQGGFPRCLYSPSERRLYFIYASGVYQYRYFGDNPLHPKWKSYGISEDYIHVSQPTVVHGSSLVLVEDIISGMKVGHITPALTLFGSNISLRRLAAIKLLGYKEAIIWLDWDKRDYAIEAARKAQSIGLQARVIHTKLDPKEYSYAEIERILTGELLIPHQTALPL